MTYEDCKNLPRRITYHVIKYHVINHLIFSKIQNFVSVVYKFFDKNFAEVPEVPETSKDKIFETNSSFLMK